MRLLNKAAKIDIDFYIILLNHLFAVVFSRRVELQAIHAHHTDKKQNYFVLLNK